MNTTERSIKMSEGIVVALISGGAVVIAASIGFIGNVVKKKGNTNKELSIKQIAKGNLSTQIGIQNKGDKNGR